MDSEQKSNPKRKLRAKYRTAWTVTVATGEGQEGTACSAPVTLTTAQAVAEFLTANAKYGTVSRKARTHKLNYDGLKAGNNWFVHGTSAPTERGKEHIRLGDYLILDIDSAEHGLMADLFADCPHACVVYPSTGHLLPVKNGLECFRLIVPLTGPLNAPAFAKATAWYAENILDLELGEDCATDACSQQVDRLMYMPCKDAVILHKEGDAFNPAVVPDDYVSPWATVTGDIVTGDMDWSDFQPLREALLSLEHARETDKGIKMPSLSGRDFTNGRNAGDAWLFMPPRGEKTEMGFISQHQQTEPAGEYGLVKALDDAGVLDVYEECKAARRQRMAGTQLADFRGKGRASNETDGDRPQCGAAPTGSGLEPAATNCALYIPEPTEEEAADWFDNGFNVVPDQQENETAEAFRTRGIAAAYKALMHKHFNDRFLLVADGSRVVDLTHAPSASPLALSDFKNACAPLRFVVGTDSKGRAVYSTYADSWLKSERRQTVIREVYQPGAPRIVNVDGADCVNTFYMPQWGYTADQSKLADWFTLAEFVLPEKKEREWFYDWLAFTVRYPQFKCPVVPTILSGMMGSGRGTINVIIGQLLGTHNVTRATDKMLAAGFDDYLYRSLLVVIEELDENSETSVDGAFRSAISDNVLAINLKGGKQLPNCRVYNNTIININKPCLTIDKDDRRIQALTGQPAGAARLDTGANEGFYQRLLKKAENDREFIAQLQSWLWRRSLADFDSARSDTTLPARAQLLANSVSDYDELADDFIERFREVGAFTNGQRDAYVKQAAENAAGIQAAKLRKMINARSQSENPVTATGGGTLRGRSIPGVKQKYDNWRQNLLEALKVQ